MERITYNLRSLNIAENTTVSFQAKAAGGGTTIESGWKELANAWTSPILVKPKIYYKISAHSESDYTISLNGYQIENLVLDAEDYTASEFSGETCSVQIIVTSKAYSPSVVITHLNSSDEEINSYPITGSQGINFTANNGDKIQIVDTSTCFPAGTPILLADGTQKAIENIQIGENVLAYDTETKQLEVSAVTEIKIGYTNRMAMLLFSDGTYLAMAEAHPLYTNEGFKSITNKDGLPTLQLGDIVKTSTGWASITDLQVVDCAAEKVYSLQLEKETQVYFVASGIAVVTHSGGSN